MEIPPRRPPQVSILIAPLVNVRLNCIANTGMDTLIKRAISTTTMDMIPAATVFQSSVTASTSSPIKTNSTAFRISSSNSQNGSRCSRVFSDMAKALPWLPIARPATTMAIGAET